MEYKNTLLVVKSLDRSKEFYLNILGLKIVEDLSSSVTFDCGISLVTEDSFESYIGRHIAKGGNNFELYFETKDFDMTLDLIRIKNVEMVHEPFKHSWGQRVVRIYDPDLHIIEICEQLKEVIKRFSDDGLNISEIANKLDVSIDYIKCMLNN